MKLLKGGRWGKKKEKLLGPVTVPPTRPRTRAIDDAFKDYIHNEIPARFVDTSNLQFVSRKDVFRVFQNEIASVTEEQIQERIRSFQKDPFATYEPRRETVLRQIIQEIVRYDILSHRWGEEADEATFQDIAGRKPSTSKFTKFAEFCKTAGSRLAWADTCCIDEMNPTERSEAIHGMYKWYANAHTCIAHLAESISYEDWDDDPWFTRGWTLQELLAPRRLKFYGKHWQPLAPRDVEDDRKFEKIIPHLENVTGIPRAVLTADNSQGVEGCGFWEIMSWASKRKTTRVEDRAYCLVGLFHVSLHIAYGEGQRAFFRFLEAVMERSPSWDVFAWSGQPSTDHFALPSSPESYPRFEADMGKDRDGIQEFRFLAHGLSLKSLPPILMKLRSFVVQERKFRVYLEQRSGDENYAGRFGDLVVECGSTRLKTIQGARQLSACIINHHATRNWEQGKLVIGKEYICFLLYRNGDEGDSWMKLATDNLLRITCLGVDETAAKDSVIRAPVRFTDRRADIAEPHGFASPLATTFIRSPTSS